tara:strand:+ start:202 stop:558 length:357 start_codon:yes stop_codon:yes gene_type:complete
MSKEIQELFDADDLGLDITGFKFMGKVPVDSGSVLITDGCYTKYIESENETFDKWYDKYCKTLDNNGGRGGNMDDKLMFASPTSHGDGHFPVYRVMDEENGFRGLFVDFCDYGDAFNV